MGEAPQALPNSCDYETLLAAEPTVYDYPALPENAGAVLCYTSATTGEPKAALFSHRSQVLHALGTGLVDSLALSQRDTVLPIVPQFHVNAWGLPYLAPLVGAKIVMPGPNLDPVSVCSLIEGEGVTLCAGVPTVWLAARDYMKANGIVPRTLARIVIGGSAVPPNLFDDLEALGIRVCHAWGMTADRAVEGSR
jgi:acyl-CoA synthetase (AMP-forming)/AMP-acid ligase II